MSISISILFLARMRVLLMFQSLKGFGVDFDFGTSKAYRVIRAMFQSLKGFGVDFDQLRNRYFFQILSQFQSLKGFGVDFDGANIILAGGTPVSIPERVWCRFRFVPLPKNGSYTVSIPERVWCRFR